MKNIFWLVLLFGVSISAQANAYVGPGLAVAIVAQIFGGPAAIVIAVLMVLFFPFKWLWKKYKKKFSKENKKNKEEVSQIDSSIESDGE